MEEENELSGLIKSIIKDAKNPQVKIITHSLDKKKSKPTKEEVYNKRISALVNLLTPIVVIPQEGGEVYTKYILESPMYREQIEDWLMLEIKRYHKY